jgi:serine/threonine protein kinase
MAALRRGDRLGPYEIVDAIGSGGMGEVFRATDTRLGRTVAIKVLPHDRVADPARKSRFLQEARAASALDHPNVVRLYDIANDSGTDFLVMEFVEGRSLDKLIARNGVPLREAVDYATQIAGALAAAHAAGIVHRDIKPANVMVTAGSLVKVLDFGLAKLVERASGPEDETLTQQSALTEAGTVVGTVEYMSPEQARARPLDQRTDIFSAGVILYEMVTGKRPFRGNSPVDTMLAVVHDSTPPLTGQPAELQEILDKALAKDPNERYQHAGDLAIDLRRFLKLWLAGALPSMRAVPTHGKRSATRWVAWGAAGAAILLAMIFAGLWWLNPRGNTPPSDISITAFTSEPGFNGEPSVSPDGQRIVYVSDRSGRFDLYLRQMGSTSDIALTTNQGDNIQPALSPDGQQVAFVSTRAGETDISHPCCDQPMAGGDIWIIPALGGRSARLLAKNANSPAWSPDGAVIAFCRTRDGLYQIPAMGGEERRVKIEGVPPTVRGASPAYSSDGRWIFFEGTQFPRIYAVRAEGGTAQQIAVGWRPVWDQAHQAVIFSNSAEGRNNSLWSQPFSTKEGKPTGPSHALTIGRGRDTEATISRDGGVLAFTAMEITFNLESADFDAEAGRMVGTPRQITSGNQIDYFMNYAPDGKSIIFQSTRGGGTHIWRLDAGSDAVQLTSDPRYEDTNPVWSLDGRWISFIRSLPGRSDLWLMAADGGNPRQIVEGVNITSRWLPDGSALVFSKNSQFFVYELATGHSRQFSQEKGFVGFFDVSPDGKWLAYQQANSWNVDVHATLIAGGPPRVVVASPKQDYHPFFSPRGDWMYFQPDHKNVYRVPGPAQDWKHADPQKITTFPESAGLFLEDPQLSADGKHLLYSRGKTTGNIWVLRQR